MNKKNSSPIPLIRPHLGGGELAFIKSALDSNWVAPTGPNLDIFEEQLEEYLGKNKKVCALNSGTAALHLALVLLGIGRGDEVICQSMTFAASANPIVYQGATPIFVDSELDTWNMCPNLLEEAISDRIAKGKKPKAIVAVHLYGMPFDVSKIVAISNKYEIPLIEDSAEAIGSTYKDEKCGTFGYLSILSFNGNKIITTSGGGALVAPTQKLKENILFLATQAKDNAPHYEHSQIGYNYRLSNICAGIGCGQMEVLPDRLRVRREINQFYTKLFSEQEGIKVFTEPSPDYRSNHWLSCITIDPQNSKVSPEMIWRSLAEDNIESRPLWKPMHLQPVFENAPFYGSKVSEKLFKTGLSLPSSTNLNPSELQRISDKLLQIV